MNNHVTKDWSNLFSFAITEINNLHTHTHTHTRAHTHFQIVTIFVKVTVITVLFYQINTALVSIRTSLKNIKINLNVLDIHNVFLT